MGRLYNATWGRAFSAIYDRAFKATEEAGLRQMRETLLARAEGRVLELGAGTGANVGLYPEAVEELVLAEPDPHMTKRLRAKLADLGRPDRIIEAPAERLPLDDGSFDTAVVTLVLCTVPNPEAALAEIARVLKPGGRLLFLEHVRSPDNPDLARWQDRLERPWHFLGDGCHCNRDTVATINASPLTVKTLGYERLPKAVPIVEPLILGDAVLPA